MTTTPEPVASPTPTAADQVVTIRYSHYWPPLLGVNCAMAIGGECLSPIAGCYPHNAGWSGEVRFCQHTQQVGRYWRTDWHALAAEHVVACPKAWPFGTQVRAFGETWTCADRGGKIIGDWLDFMTPQPHLPHGQLTEVEVLQ